jgi:hypothetical protein
MLVNLSVKARTQQTKIAQFNTTVKDTDDIRNKSVAKKQNTENCHLLQTSTYGNKSPRNINRNEKESNCSS